MAQQLPAIIVIAPLVISFLIFFSGLWHKRIAYPLAVMAMSICLLASVGILQWVIVDGTISYWLGGWQPPWGIEYRIDHLNAVMLVIVSVLGLLATVQANSSVARELPEKTTLFWSPPYQDTRSYPWGKKVPSTPAFAILYSAQLAPAFTFWESVIYISPAAR
jgi:multicomponent Na+:H+ antiporter subunit D